MIARRSAHGLSARARRRRCAVAGAIAVVVGPQAILADGDGGMIVFNVPESVGEPDHATSLDLEYQVQGDETVRAARRQVHGSAYMRVRVSAAGVDHSGAINVRCRWNVDGAPQGWSDYEALTVTNTTLPTTNSIDLLDNSQITVTLNKTVAWGRFRDGQPWVVDPTGVTATAKTPAQSTDGSGDMIHGAQLGAAQEVQGLDERADHYNASWTYDYATNIGPGRCLIAARSYTATADLGDNNFAAMDWQGVLTVLAERPPKDCYRPTVFDNAGMDRPIYHVSERDLSRVGTFAYGTEPSAANIAIWLEAWYKHPFLSLGGASNGSRSCYAYKQTQNYHGGIAQDQLTPLHMILGAAIPLATREAVADAHIQRMIDVVGANRSAKLRGSHNPYWWEAAVAFAGALLDDTLMKGHAFYGEWEYAEYDRQNASGFNEPKVYTWNDVQTIGAPRFRNLAQSAEDMHTPGVQVWERLKNIREDVPVPAAGRAFDLAYWGITDNGDGTVTIPANRFNHGLDVCMSVGSGAKDGDVYLLDVRTVAKRPNSFIDAVDPDVGNNVNWTDGSTTAGWGSPAGSNSPLTIGKVLIYTRNHGPQTSNAVLALVLIDMAEYFGLGETKVRFGRAWAELPPEWYVALGHPLESSGGYDYQTVNARAGRTPSGSTTAAAVAVEWLKQNYVARLTGPKAITRTKTAPGKVTRAMFTVEDLGTGTAFSVRMDKFPHDGGSPITGFEVSVDGGETWQSLGISTVKGTGTRSGLTADTDYAVSVRAVNAIDAGEGSDVQTVNLPAIDNKLNSPGTWNLALAGTPTATITENGVGPTGEPSFDFVFPNFGTRTVLTNGIGGTKDVDTVDVSFYVKKNAGAGFWLYIQLRQGSQADPTPNLYSWVNLNTGARVGTDFGTTVVDQGGGWLRVSFSVLFPFTSGFTIGFGAKDVVTLASANTGNFAISDPIATVT